MMNRQLNLQSAGLGSACLLMALSALVLFWAEVPLLGSGEVDLPVGTLTDLRAADVETPEIVVLNDWTYTTDGTPATPDDPRGRGR
jgi:hypothetical protein